MGEKGASYSEDVGSLAEELVDTFAPLGEVTWKKMFGGAGLFIDGSMFALIDTDCVLHLKADDSNVEELERRGGIRHGRMPYYSVTRDVMNGAEGTLVGLGRLSAEIAKTS